MVVTILDRIEKIPTWMWIFTILCLNKLGFDLSGGEEQYLSFAKQFMDPEWIKNSFVYSEYAGSRIVFQVIVGFAMKWLSFAWTTFIFRLLNFLLFAHAFSLLFKKIGLSNLQIWFILQLYLVITQSFFSSAWLFNGFEPKTVAYAFSVYGIFFYLDHKLSKSFFLLSIAAYFHILVAGWMALYLIIHLLWTKKDLLKTLKYGLFFLLAIAPILYYIVQGIIHVPPEEIVSGRTVSANHIYAYYRLPHHSGLFKSLEYFKEVHLNGITWMYIMTIVLLLVKNRVNRSLTRLIDLVIIIAIIITIFLFIAFLDHSIYNNSGGFLLSSYPFRGNVWIKIFGVIILSKIAFELIKFGHRSQTQIMIFIVICFATTTLETINNIKVSVRAFNRSNLHMLSQYMHQNADPDSRFITYGFSEKERLPLGRTLNMEPYIEFKFVPAGTDKIYEWYRRCKVFDQFQRDGDTKVLLGEHIDVIITQVPIQLKNYELADSVGGFNVYKLTAIK